MNKYFNCNNTYILNYLRRLTCEKNAQYKHFNVKIKNCIINKTIQKETFLTLEK